MDMQPTRKIVRALFVGVLVLTTPGAWAWAQATASVSGTARDNSGGVLPGVTITVTQTQTGFTRTTVTNDTGSYSLPNLPLGPYRFEASLQGFSTYTQTNLLLQVGSVPVIDPTLNLGGVTESIEVRAAAPLVNTRSAAIGTVVESQQIVELPLNARQVTQLVTLSGLAVETGGAGPGAMQTGVRISVAGSNDFGVSYSLDGAPHLNNYDGTGLNLPFPDALQEFNLVTGAQDASSGSIRAGASVNAVTKAGNNVLHGDAFEFLRDSRFNAPDFFSGRKDGLRRNQFGGTLGGPIVRDKLFFFAGYQATTTRQTPTGSTSFVPTSAMMAGDFTAFALPACNNGRQLTLRAPFVNNRIDPALISPAALNIASRMPEPLDACGRVLWGAPLQQNEGQLVSRVDYQASGPHSFFGRYLLTTFDQTNPYDLSNGNLLATTGYSADDWAHSATFGHTWVVGPAMVNSFRAFGNDIRSNNSGAHAFGPADIGIKASTYVPNFMSVVASGGAFNIMNPFGTHNVIITQNAGVSDDFTMVLGSHEVKLGGRYLWTKSDSEGHAFSAGRYLFTGQFTGNALADFMLGRLGPFTQGNPNEVKATQPVVGAYVQDTWRLNRVTLNYGVVWNPYFSPDFYTGEVYNFSREKFLAGELSTVMKNAPPGFSFLGDPGFKGTSGINPHYSVWDPRVSVAWDPAGDGRNSVRAGVSMGHDYPTHTTYLLTTSVPPFRTTVVLPPGGSLDDPWANYPGGNPFPYTFNAENPRFPIYSAYLPMPPDLEPTTQYSWNVSYQRQFASALFASASYIGTRLTNMLGTVEQNPALNMGFDPCTLYDATIAANRFYPVCTVSSNINQRRALNQVNPTAALGYVTQYDDAAYQRYHGLLLNTRVTASDALNFSANYTLSTCEQASPWSNAIAQPGNNRIHQPYQNNGPTDIRFEEGPCPQDRRHIFNLRAVFTSGTYDGVVGGLASNWTVSSVVQARSGSPVNVATGLDNALNGFFIQNGTPTQRPNLVPGVDPYGDTSGLTGFFNPDAFSQPAPGTYGDAPYNYLRGPAFWQWDQAFTRSVPLVDGHRLELRAEIINVTNRFNRGNPNAVLNSPSFGRITTLAAGATPRIWQFAVKYTF